MKARDDSLQRLSAVCRLVDSDPTGRFTLGELAHRAGISAFRLHRLFKSILGVTPRAYVEQARLRTLKRGLRSGSSVTQAILDAGFESSSAVYGRLQAQLGMTPRHYSRGGAGAIISFAFGLTVAGHVLIGATDRGICYLQFGDSEGELIRQLLAEFPHAQVEPSPAQSDQDFTRWMRALNAHIEEGKTHGGLPLDIQGTAFQKRVWEFLRTIPRGTVVSYADVARGIGAPASVRAAASACARNRIGVLIPCHRVLRGTGELGGYRWGIERKQLLLALEKKRRGNPRR